VLRKTTPHQVYKTQLGRTLPKVTMSSNDDESQQNPTVNSNKIKPID